MGFDFEAAVQAPFRMQPGLRRLADGARQLSLSLPSSRHLHEKLLALGADAPTALQCMPGFDPRPALHTLARQAAAEHASGFSWDGHTATAHELGWAVRDEDVLDLRDAAHVSHVPHTPHAAAEVGACLRRLPAPWRLGALLALAFEEDFAIIDARSATIPWLAVALPSHWAPERKVGLHFAQVHAPVADNQVLLAAGDALARLVAQPSRWERFVWTVTANPRLNAHPASAAAAPWLAGDAQSVAAQAWWRTERQTFIPVAEAAQAVFTIRVQTQALALAIDSPAKARQLHASLASMSPAVLHYRSLSTVRDDLLAWLAQRAGA